MLLHLFLRLIFNDVIYISTEYVVERKYRKMATWLPVQGILTFRNKSGRHKEHSTETVRHAYRSSPPKPGECQGSDDPGGDGDQHHGGEIEVLVARDAGGVDDGAAVHEHAAEEASCNHRNAAEDLLGSEDVWRVLILGFSSLKSERLTLRQTSGEYKL